jgi:hypothetical protein
MAPTCPTHVRQHAPDLAQRPRPRQISNALFKLSTLSLRRPGTHVERLERGHPEADGRHEPMRLTPKEATRLPGIKVCSGRKRFDEFFVEYNRELFAMKCPAATRWQRAYRAPPDVTCPFYDRDIRVTTMPPNLGIEAI